MASNMLANWKEGLRASVTSMMAQCVKIEEEILGRGIHDGRMFEC